MPALARSTSRRPSEERRPSLSAASPVAAMADALGAAQMQVARQVFHWRAAVVGLRNPDNFASAQAWESLERYLGLALRGHLTGAAEALGREADVLVAELRATQTA